MQEPTRLLVLRHGRTAWNVETRIQGQMDAPLDALGRWQAERLGAAVAEALAGEAIAAVYSSDLQRALHTAQPLARRAGMAVLPDLRLRERGFGSFEGHTHAEIEATWPEAAQRWRQRDVDFQPGGGEALTTFYARCVGAVSELAARHPGRTIAIFAHGGVLDCLYRAAVGVTLNAPRSWQLGNATINRLLHHGEGLSLVGWNDDAHLEGAEAAPAA